MAQLGFIQISLIPAGRVIDFKVEELGWGYPAAERDSQASGIPKLGDRYPSHFEPRAFPVVLDKWLFVLKWACWVLTWFLF